jgi:uncharacterized membrane protein
LEDIVTLSLLDTLTLLAAVGAGIIGGTFFGFSTFIMGALGRLPAPHGIAAMQSINVVVINPWFLTPFLGTAVLCLAIAALAIARWTDPAAPYLLAAAVLYFGGTFLVTMRLNVPRNDALAAATATTGEAAHLWARYLVEWTAWNHVRTLAALVAMLGFVLAFRLLR